MQKLLIVEDDETIRFGLKYYLEQEGFDIYQAATLKEAFDKFSQTDVYKRQVQHQLEIISHILIKKY